MPSTLELTGPQFRPLSQALRTTLKLNEFDQMLLQSLNLNREDFSVAGDYPTIVFDVIGAANRAGWVYRLVNAARQERPKNDVFVEYARLLGIGPRDLPDKDGLESIINATNAALDIAVFRERIGAIEGQVCRVDLNGDGAGTGFLVGPDLVLTNYHVIEDVVKNGASIGSYSCLFDFKVRPDGTTVSKGIQYPVKKLLAFSSYDEQADLTPDSPQADPAKLDYALLQLDDTPGQLPISNVSNNQEKRGWIAMPTGEHSFGANTPLFIVQHPAKRPMKLALDTQAVIGVNTNNTRVRYRTNTEPGSSGSPCFNQNWELVALHHSGDTNWVPTWNQGIPIRRIVEHDAGKHLP
jgi:V8-like Glu-specific endopeptidase